MINERQIQYVITLADAGSFSAAADALNISQPSLSQYIKKIEETVGVQLFERANGNVKLTDAGKVYIEAGRRILDVNRWMHNRITDISDNKSGSITVGTSPFRSVSLMPSVAAKFREKYNGMHIIVREMTTQELLDAAERSEFDLCVVPLPVNELIFDAVPVMEEEFVLAVKKGCAFDKLLSQNAVTVPNRTFKAIDAKKIDHQAFVMLTDNQLMQKALNNLILQYNLTLSTAVVVKSLEAQSEMVSAGIGAAVIPFGTQKSSRLNDNISYYSFIQELPKRILAVIYKKGKYLTEPMQDLIETIKTI